MSKIPFVEAYRPVNFENIVLDPINKTILSNIIETSYFPNLLFYGPPGTGKTTTIINMIKSYQEKNGQTNSGLCIHLNASDERGIDIIRNQINQFANTKTLFNTGMKFVILDEVDYMTKTAQQALRYLLQSYLTTIRFCLICNYICKIDESLQNEFVKLKFNQLPKEHIVKYIETIAIKENISITRETILELQKIYNSDLRSMINYLQSNQHVTDISILTDKPLEILYTHFKNGKTLAEINTYLTSISQTFNTDKRNIIKQYLYYIIRNHTHILSSPFLDLVENILHASPTGNLCLINYSIIKLSKFT
jgi:DNA polymerase III delta prime subunit